jgi:hypothetical protein
LGAQTKKFGYFKLVVHCGNERYVNENFFKLEKDFLNQGGKNES